MKQIIDNDTGEVIEVEETNELVKKQLYELGAIDKETFEILESYLYYEEQYKIFRHKLENAMGGSSIKSWINDYFTAYIAEDSIQKVVDVERLKQDGLYEKYLKLVHKKGGLRIKFKERKYGD